MLAHVKSNRKNIKMSDSPKKTQRVFILGQNLFFLPRISSIAEHLGVDIKLANTKLEFWEAYREYPPALVLIDLEGECEIWHQVLLELKNTTSSKYLIAFGPHSDLKSIGLAKSLGCDQVLSKGEFSRDMQKLLEKYSRPFNQ